MTRKRRMFEVDLPEAATFPAGKVHPDPVRDRTPRRGPMAAAIAENAESLRDREETEAAIRAENDALAHEFVRLKKLGLIVDLVPLEQIVAEKLSRDRAPGPDADLAELQLSIRDVGLSNPIRVERRDDGRYELVQGSRRLQAYRGLLAETADPRFAAVPAGILPRGESLASMYRRMVDENLVRKDISFAEMAELARSYAADPQTACPDIDRAVAELFKSAGYQKRTYIRAFARLLEMLDPALVHPEAIPRNLGLAILKRLEEDAGLAAPGWHATPIARSRMNSPFSARLQRPRLHQENQNRLR